MSQPLQIWENHLAVFVSLEICPAICHAWKNIKKVTVSRNLRQTHLLEVDLTKTPGDHKTLSTIRHVGFHVDISSVHEAFFSAFSPSRVKRTWTVSAISTNESSQTAMVKGLQSCLWNGPWFHAPPPITKKATTQLLSATLTKKAAAALLYFSSLT